MVNVQPFLTGSSGGSSDMSIFVSEDSQSLYAYLGLALLERVPRERDKVCYKMLVGRLVNSGGHSLRELSSTFGHDHRTLRSWGNALLSGDLELMAVAFAGQGALPKVKPDIAATVAALYREYAGRYHDYRQRIQAYVLERHGERLSGEALRQLFRRTDDEDAEEPDPALGEADGGAFAEVIPGTEDGSSTGATAAASHANGWAPPAIDPPCAAPDGERGFGIVRDAGIGEAVAVSVGCGHAAAEAPGGREALFSDDGRVIDSGAAVLADGATTACGSASLLSADDPVAPVSIDRASSDASATVVAPVREAVAEAGDGGRRPEGEPSPDRDPRDNGGATAPLPASEPGVPRNLSPTPPDNPAEKRRPPCSGAPVVRGLIPVSHLPAPRDPRLVCHAGQILFSPWLSDVADGRPPGHRIQEQWLGQILQGAVNIEQTKTVCVDDLSFFTGEVRANRHSQRAALKRQALPETVWECLRRNARIVPGMPEAGGILYYDVHTEHYTGCEPILKGWCGARHTVTKVLNMDFIHTLDGYPLFVWHADNYYDLRERFFLVLHQFRETFPAAARAPVTWVVDRGIYGLETFAAFRQAGDHLITWEKGYARDGWRPELGSVSFALIRERNRPGDILTWNIRCQEYPWHRDPCMRRIIARITGPDRRTGEVSILCDDPDRGIETVVSVMAKRWLQENDFWYMTTYVGIGQITAYASQSYADIADTLHDRPMECPEYKELRKQLAGLEKDLAGELLDKEKKWRLIAELQTEDRQLDQARHRRIQWCQAELDYLQDRRDTPPEEPEGIPGSRDLIKRRRKIAQRVQLLQSRGREHEDHINELWDRSRATRDLMDSALRENSRVGLLILQGYRRLDTRAKAVMDALRITARNAFHRLLEHFRPMYGNYRDDHVQLRTLTRSSGIIWADDNGTVHIRLWIKATLQHAERQVLIRFLEHMTHHINNHFNGTAAGPVDIRLRDLEQPPFL